MEPDKQENKDIPNLNDFKQQFPEKPILGGLHNSPCPNCGYCPCCGRPRGNYPVYPVFPYQPTLPIYQVYC